MKIMYKAKLSLRLSARFVKVRAITVESVHIRCHLRSWRDIVHDNSITVCTVKGKLIKENGMWVGNVACTRNTKWTHIFCSKAHRKGPNGMLCYRKEDNVKMDV